MKRVLIITYYWPPSGGAGVQRWLKFCKYLPEFGWQPVVITVKLEDATYPALDPGMEKEIPEDLRVIRTPSRNFFRFYKQIFRTQQVPSGGFANQDSSSVSQKVARFIRGNFFLPDPRKGWNSYAFKEAKKLLTEESGFEAILTSSPPHSTQLIGLKLKKSFNIPWIADLRDPWTDIYYYDQLYPGFLARRINRSYERQVLENADRVITVGSSLQTLFSTKYNLPERKVTVVQNGFDEDDFSHVPAKKDPHFTITYVGTLSDVYPIANLVEIFAELLLNEPGMKLRFVGDVSASQRKRLNRIPSENMEFVDYVSHTKAIEYMERSHLLLLVIPKHATSKEILTGKLFEYLASGQPVLGIGPSDGDASAVLKECQAGEMIDFTDRDRLKIILSTWLDMWKQGKSIIDPKGREKYSRRNLTAIFARQLNEVTADQDY